MADGAGAVVEAFGDSAVLVRIGDRVDPELAARSQSIAAAIEAARRDAPALGRPVPAHASVLVPVDPLALDLDEAIETVRGLLSAATATSADAGEDAPPDAPPLEIAVRYGGADGPDLDEVAHVHGLRPVDVAELHAGARYRVLFLGFAPGFAYLGGLPAELVTPRRATPRERVPAGSVAVAGEQTAIYPLAMPGGWNLIGQTDAMLFDPARTPPTPLRPGLAVRFVPASARRRG